MHGRKVCESCGCEPHNGHAYCNNCGTTSLPQAVMCPSCKYYFNQQGFTSSHDRLEVDNVRIHTSKKKWIIGVMLTLVIVAGTYYTINYNKSSNKDLEPSNDHSIELKSNASEENFETLFSEEMSDIEKQKQEESKKIEAIVLDEASKRQDLNDMQACASKVSELNEMLTRYKDVSNNSIGLWCDEKYIKAETGLPIPFEDITSVELDYSATGARRLTLIVYGEYRELLYVMKKQDNVDKIANYIKEIVKCKFGKEI